MPCGVSAFLYNGVSSMSLTQSQPASAKLQKVFKELTLWSRKV